MFCKCNQHGVTRIIGHFDLKNCKRIEFLKNGAKFVSPWKVMATRKDYASRRFSWGKCVYFLSVGAIYQILRRECETGVDIGVNCFIS